ncbi:MAG: sulfotransferase, partial [Flavobacteriales bacterium]|nr:sulfotransferase [Flavobacteriales bacterium]
RLVEPMRVRLRPSAIVVGVQKAGTSALFDMLGAHPSVLVPTVKEIGFFNDDAYYARGPSAYRNVFPLKPIKGPTPITLEATPEYIFSRKAMERISSDLPEVKLILILRDPVHRAYSAWNMYRSFKTHPRFGHLHDPRPFEVAVRDELEERPYPLQPYYLARGLYALQVGRMNDLFPRERVLVLAYERFRDAPVETLDEVCAYLGIDPVRDPEVLAQRSNVRPYGSALDAGLESELRRYFAERNSELVDILGPSFDWS